MFEARAANRGTIVREKHMTAVVRRTAWVVLVAVLFGVLGAAYVVRANAKGVVSTAQLVVTGRASASSQDTPYTANQYVSQRMSTYAAVATSDVVLDPAAQSLGVDASVLAGSIVVTVPKDTTVIALSAAADDPKQAQQRAQAVLTVLSNQIVALETEPGVPPRVDVRILSGASAPGAESLPPAPLAALLGLAAGAVLAMLALLATRLLNTRMPAAAPDSEATTDPGTVVAEPKGEPTRPPAKSGPQEQAPLETRAQTRLRSSQRR